MFSNKSPKMRFLFLWLAIGYSLVATVVYLSVTSVPVELELSYPYQDKVHHLFAYFVLMAWFAQIYHEKKLRYLIAVVFIALGVGMEYIQSFDPARMSEVGDMIANTVGVFLGFILTLNKAKEGLLELERLIP